MGIKKHWEDIGTKIGIEIHQELSGSKLFCSCSADLMEKNKVLEITREIRPSGGETGEIDIASLYEQEKKRKFVYYGYEDEYCLVDTDCEPPHQINRDALRIALEVAMLLKLQIPDELIVMRKVISNGSVISGFQRSLLVGIGDEESFIKTPEGRVRIKDLYLEEDAAKIIKKEENLVYFSLSRAGIPLLEVGTHPDIKTPEHAKELAAHIGMILRSVPGVKRGIGSIRQDINMSIKGGDRVELKGFQDLRSMPKVIENEIMRQLEIKKQDKKVEKEVRMVNPDGTTNFLRPLPGAARLYPETDLPVIPVTKEFLKSIKKPVLLTERIEALEQRYSLHAEIARALIYDEHLELFEELTKKFSMPELIAKTLVLTVKDLKNRLNLPSNRLKKKDFEEVFSYVQKGLIDKDAVAHVLADKLQGTFHLQKYEKVNEKDLEFHIKNLVKEKNNLNDSALMGIIMKEYQGKVNGKKVMEILKRIRGT